MHVRKYLFFYFLVMCSYGTCCSAMNLWRNMFKWQEVGDINALGSDGMTPLMRAFTNQAYEEALKILKKSPSLVSKSASGYTVFEIFLAAHFSRDQQAILARELIRLAIIQDVMASVPHDIRSYALRGASPQFIAFLHVVAPNQDTARTISKYGLNPSNNTESWENLLKVSIGPFLAFYLAWLFLNKIKLPTQAPARY